MLTTVLHLASEVSGDTWVQGGGLLVFAGLVAAFLKDRAVDRRLAASERRDMIKEFTGRMAVRDAIIKDMHDENLIAKNKSDERRVEIVAALTRNTEVHERVEVALNDNTSELRLLRERRRAS